MWLSNKKNKITEPKKGESKIFYQYQRINENKDPLKNLKNNELFFNSPSEFDDLYDSYCDFIYEGVKNEFSRFLSPDEKFKKEENIYSLNPGIYTRKKNNLRPIEFRKDTKVCCFSELGRSLLLWSLYADRSKGICFGFEGKYIGRAGKNLGLAHDRKCYSFDLETGMVFSDPILYEVIYQPSLPKQVNRVTNKNDVLLLDFLLTKQTEWVFEQEYRLIDLTPNEEPYILHRFKKEALKSVFLGYKTPSSVAVDVRDIIETEYLQKGYTVELYQMVPLDRKYALVPKKIDLDTL